MVLVPRWIRRRLLPNAWPPIKGALQSLYFINMTNNNHPITPPPELVKKWHDEIRTNGIYEEDIATKAARWGADMELKACCEWIEGEIGAIDPSDLRAARRPKPKSLAAAALEALDQANEGLTESEWPLRHDIIRRALERLEELEGQADD